MRYRTHVEVRPLSFSLKLTEDTDELLADVAVEAREVQQVREVTAHLRSLPQERERELVAFMLLGAHQPA
jgi:hypothetical protein